MRKIHKKKKLILTVTNFKNLYIRKKEKKYVGNVFYDVIAQTWTLIKTALLCTTAVEKFLV